MGEAHSMLGFVVLAILYVVIGIMAARGTICIFRKIFPPKSEQIFYAVFLIVIAAWKTPNGNGSPKAIST